MQAFLTGLLAAALPILLSLGRMVMAVLAIWIIVRCARSLFEPQAQEQWGVMTLANGTRYELCHWENVIGRAKNADVRVNFPSVSRNHAAVCRDDSGRWMLYPLQNRNGILLNGQRVDEPSPLQNGDVIAVGGVELYFFPAGAQEEAALAEQRAKAGRAGYAVAAHRASGADAHPVPARVYGGELSAHFGGLRRAVRRYVASIRRVPAVAAHGL